MAYDFTAASAHTINYGTTDLIGAGNQWSASVWVYPDVNTGNQTFMCKRDAFSGSSSTGNNFVLGLSASGTGKLVATVNSTAFVHSTATVGTGSWQHVAFRGTSTDAVLYLDNSGDARGSALNSGNDTGAEIAIGGLYTEASEYFDGRIAEVAVWQGDIGAGVVAALSAGFSPLFFKDAGAGLKFYCPLVRNQNDISFNGLSGTVNSAAVIEHSPGIIYPSFAPVVFAPVAGGGGTIAPQLYHHRFHNLAA